MSRELNAGVQRPREIIRDDEEFNHALLFLALFGGGFRAPGLQLLLERLGRLVVRVDLKGLVDPGEGFAPLVFDPFRRGCGPIGREVIDLRLKPRRFAVVLVGLGQAVGAVLFSRAGVQGQQLLPGRRRDNR